MRWDGGCSPWELPAHPGAAGPHGLPLRYWCPFPGARVPPARAAAAEPPLRGCRDGAGHGGHPCHAGCPYRCSHPTVGGCPGTCGRRDGRGGGPPVTQSYSIIF